MDRPSPRSRRRRLLRRAIVALAALCLVGLVTAALVAWTIYRDARQSNVGELSFATPLAVPPLAPSRTVAGERVFDLRIVEGARELVPGRRTPTWGVGGPHLAPTLRAAAGERVRVNLTNAAREETTIHWHGMRLPAAMDGGPHQRIAPGATWSPAWRIEQPAATLWYHPHPHGRTAEHVARGLVGLFLLDDERSRALGLPSQYGVDDVPVIIQDLRVRGDGSLDRGGPPFSSAGPLGDRILVNGTYDPHLRAVSERLRLRLVNASLTRVYDLGFTDGRPFAMIASDSGLLEAPLERTRVRLSPGERAEIVVALRPGDRPVLRSFPPDLGAGFWNDRMYGGDDTFDILQIRAAARLRPAPAPPARLAPAQRPPAPARATRRFELDGSGTKINGRSMDLGRIDAAVRAGSTEVWEVEGGSVPHNFHVHGVDFRLLSIDDEPPPPELRGPEDTIYVRPGARYRLAIRFGAHADPGSPYMLHCHILRHEDRGMMGQFVVIAPGTEPPRRLAPAHAAHRRG